MGSLQDTLLCSNKDFLGFAAVSSPFVQVLNNHSSHWVTVASPPSDIPAHVILYDSLCTGVTSPTKTQIVKLLAAAQSPIRCVIDTREVQIGTDECGLFAMAAAMSICYCPGSLKNQLEWHASWRNVTEGRWQGHWPYKRHPHGISWNDMPVQDLRRNPFNHAGIHLGHYVDKKLLGTLFKLYGSKGLLRWPSYYSKG